MVYDTDDSIYIINIYIKITVISGHTLRLFNVAIEYGPFIVDLPIKSGDYP